eukprot:CCRYP_008481-RB/>CCRYP_008481-RB protein AED:0.47 eAED:1.00 QI:0/0/0/1/0/0/2/0/85
MGWHLLQHSLRSFWWKYLFFVWRSTGIQYAILHFEQRINFFATPSLHDARSPSRTKQRVHLLRLPSLSWTPSSSDGDTPGGANKE